MAEFNELLKSIKGTLTEEEETGFCLGADALLNKACEWIKNNKDSDYINDGPCQFGGRAELDDLFIEEFRKAMEE